MSTALAPVEVCNLSFDLLRHKERVGSIEDPQTELESLAARWYDVVRRSNLRNFPFNFARKRMTISRNPVGPPFGYPDAYDFPSEYLGVAFVGENYDQDYEWDYVIEGNQILIDNSGASSLNICLIKDITEVPRFDPLFLELFVADLATRFGASLTGLNKSMKDVSALKKTLESRARAKNGHDNPPRVRYRSPLINARRGLGRRTQSDGVHLFP